ncbi:heme-binding beta-barrel domain-containing protein [Paraburkholderia acidicola]|uniref:Heme-binding beta-barrel domain-containing protein n=1 Tax=Paraburkholderia acidicola TaxID=1912599 RepID=A0ABV1LRD5_9BURK
MKRYFACLAIFISTIAYAKDAPVNGMDLGPLGKLAGTWKSADSSGVDVAPGQEHSQAGKGAPAVSPYYEVLTFEPAADATNASDQYLAAMYYKQEVFRRSDNKKFHDQRGYLIYDKKNQMVYDTFCIPRAVCVVAEGKAGDKMTLKSSPQGIAETQYMSRNDKTTGFTITYDLSGSALKYSQQTSLYVYNKPFQHVDSSALVRVK